MLIKSKIYYYNGGFLLSGVNKIPEGAILISRKKHIQLLNAQSMGMEIKVIEGMPTAMDREVSGLDFEEFVRSRRDEKLKSTDVFMISDFPISPFQREKLIEYRQALRDLPEEEGFPWVGTEVPWPQPDESIKDLIKEN